MLRHLFLFLSRQKQLRRWMETSPVFARLTSRFVAGNTLEEALRVCGRLNAEKILATLDHLGENVSSLEEAEASRDAYLAAIDAIAGNGLESSVSIKPTQFGLDFSEDACRANVFALARRATAAGSRVEVDMESHPYVDRTLALVECLRGAGHDVRAVIQAYLYRSEKDIEGLNAKGIPVRLCKGAYDEPAAVAYPGKRAVDANYVKLADLLLRRGAYPAMATHDEAMIRAAVDSAKRHRRGAGEFEFQMLYGVRRDLQRRLVKEGYRVRLYVPYGKAWYPYFMRRLAERPANVLFLAKNLLRA